MEIVNHTIKCVDEFKCQIAVPLQHITLNVPDNTIQATSRLKQQHESLKRKSTLIMKDCEKIKQLKTQGYIEKVHPEETMINGLVWYMPHFLMQQAKF